MNKRTQTNINININKQTNMNSTSFMVPAKTEISPGLDMKRIKPVSVLTVAGDVAKELELTK